VVVQFLSYEGSFAATDGAASGDTSVDIGVSEGSSAVTGTSMQLQGTGCAYADFAWSTGVAETFGAVNASQVFSGD
jgi:uncharacterized protein